MEKTAEADVSPRRCQGARKALSLVEVMLAMVLLAVVYLPISELLHTGAAQTIKSRHHLIATNLAANLFELYRVSGDAVLETLSGSGTLSSPDALQSAKLRALLTGDDPGAGQAGGQASDLTRAMQAGHFKMKLEVERAVGGRTGLDRIEATISWEEDGVTHSQTYARLVAP